MIETHKHSKSQLRLEVVGYSAVESSPLAELRGSDTDAAAVTQFVNGVENIDDIETDFDGSLCRDLDTARQVNVECLVRMVFLGVCETPA